MMCKGQAYGNDSTMSLIHSAAQRRIKDINSKAIFVPCGKHSLNLAGGHAVGSSELSDIFHSYFTKCDIIRSLRFYCMSRLVKSQ